MQIKSDADTKAVHVRISTKLQSVGLVGHRLGMVPFDIFLKRKPGNWKRIGCFKRFDGIQLEFKERYACSCKLNHEFINFRQGHAT